MATALADLLDPQHVVPELAAKSEADVLREIVGTFGDDAIEDRGRFLDELIAREQLQSTNTCNGVAFPHARTEAVRHIVLAIGRSRAGVTFREDEPPVRLLFVIGTPSAMVRDYLLCIGTLARLLRGAEFRDRLMNAASADQLIGELRRAVNGG